MPLIVALKHRLFPGLNTGTPVPLRPTRVPQGAAPRIIHQTFPTKDLPPALAENLLATKATNPDWEHRLHDDADIEAFIGRHYGAQMRRTYLRINPRYGAARADLFRYLLMYEVGGVYLDIKAATRLPLSTVIRGDDRYLISQWPKVTKGRFRGWGQYPELSHVPGGEFQQWCIVAAPGHPFLQAVIERVLANLDLYLPSMHGVGRWPVLRLTGPIAYTVAIAPLLASQPHRTVDLATDLGIDYSIFDKSTTHMQLFTSHYGTQTDPIVALRPGQAILDRAVRVARRVRHLAHGRPRAG